MTQRTMALAGAFLIGLSGCSLFDSLGDDDSGSPDGGLGGFCEAATDCAPNLVCAGGTCQLEGSVGMGGPCWATRDCAAGLFCAPSTMPDATAGVCAPAGDGAVGDPCATEAECERGLVCRLYGFGGTCEEAGATDLGGACTEQLDCLAGLACAPDGTCKSPEVAFPPFTGVECADDATPFKVYFEVPRPDAPPADFFRLPFPNDARVDASGNLDMSDFPRPGPSSVGGIDLVDLYVDALVDDFTGFSPVGPVIFRFSSRLDFSTASASNVHFVDLTTGGERGRSWAYTTGRTLYNCQHRLVVRTGTDDPLRGDRTYAVYLTTGLRAHDGNSAAVQDDDFAAVIGDTRPSGDEALGHAWDQYAPFRAYLASEGISPDTIAAAAVFTAMDAPAKMEALAAATAAEPAPVVQDLTLCDGTNVSPCDDGGDRACGAVDADYYEIHGRVRIPIFQQGTAPYEFEGGAIELSGGNAVKVRDEMVCFAMTVPKGAAQPGGGWPYVVYGHGTGGSMRSFINNGVAAELATASTPTVVVGFDGVVHGARAGTSTRDPDNLMFNIVNPPAARDNHLQGAVDVLAVLRMHEAGALDVTGVGSVSLDGTQRYFFGHSQGSNVGIPAIATSSAAPAAIFSGAGAYLTSSLLNKTSPVDAQAALQFVVDPDFDNSHPVMTVFQTYFDPTDTINFAPLLIKRPRGGLASKHVLQTYGPGDTYSPPGSMERMADGAGLHVVTPEIDDLDLTSINRPVGTNVTGGDSQPRLGAIFQYMPGDYDGHFVATRNANAVTDWTNFLMSLIETGTPAVP